MELLKAIILGIVQGLTEFLPISSSGHLVIGSEILNFHEQGIVFDVFLHLGTLVSVIIVFRKKIILLASAPFQYISGNRSDEVMLNLKWDIFIVISIIPAVFVGLFFKDFIESLFTHLSLVFIMLSITGIIMISTQFLKRKEVQLNSKHALLIGCAQALAIMPGISRSGSTIFTGMALGIDRQIAAEFSFIMSIPAILGAVVLQLKDLATSPLSTDSMLNISVGTVAATISGYFAIVLLLDIVRKNRLQWFGYYCLALSSCGMAYLFFS